LGLVQHKLFGKVSSKCGVKMSKKKVKIEKKEAKKNLFGKNVHEKGDFLEDLQRVQAEFEKYTKRVEKEKEQIRERAKAEVLLKLINVKEDLDKANLFGKNIHEKTDLTKLKEGLEMIHKNLKKTLEEEGVSEIKSIGEEFNHEVHEVVKKKGEGKISEEVQRGYMLGEKVLRVSKVVMGEEK
jgi:molecular chaperone GrpE